MKRAVLLGLWLATVSLAGSILGFAQDASDFRSYLRGANEVPPNDSAARGQGTFSLEGNVLQYIVGLASPALAPTGAGIFGPALPGRNGEEIFDLGAPIDILSPNGGGGLAYVGALNLTEGQIAQLEGGLWYVNVRSAKFPNGEIRGQICPQGPDSDCDYDGVPNKDDLCPNTPPGAVVDGTGCSIDELVPCAGGWRDHKEYVKAVRAQAFRFWKEGRITVTQRNATVQQAQNSDCGNPP